MRAVRNLGIMKILVSFTLSFNPLLVAHSMGNSNVGTSGVETLGDKGFLLKRAHSLVQEALDLQQRAEDSPNPSNRTHPSEDLQGVYDQLRGVRKVLQEYLKKLTSEGDGLEDIPSFPTHNSNSFEDSKLESSPDKQKLQALLGEKVKRTNRLILAEIDSMDREIQGILRKIERQLDLRQETGVEGAAVGAHHQLIGGSPVGESQSGGLFPALGNPVEDEYSGVFNSLAKTSIYNSLRESYGGRPLQVSRNIDPSILYPFYYNNSFGGGGFGNDFGYNPGVITKLLLATNLLNRDYEKESVLLMQRYKGVDLDGLADGIINRNALGQVVAGVVTDVLNQIFFPSYRPRPTPSSGSSGGDFPPNGFHLETMGQRAFNENLITGMGSNSLPRAFLSVTGDVVVPFLIYADTYLSLASLYGYQVKSYSDWMVGMGLSMVAAHSISFFKNHFPKTGKTLENSVVRKAINSLGTLLSGLGKRNQFSAEIQELQEKVKSLEQGEQTKQTKKINKKLRGDIQKLQNQIQDLDRKLTGTTRGLAQNRSFQKSLGGILSQKPGQTVTVSFSSSPPKLSIPGSISSAPWLSEPISSSPQDQLNRPTSPPSTNPSPASDPASPPKTSKKTLRVTLGKLLGAVIAISINSTLRFGLGKGFGKATKAIMKRAYLENRRRHNQNFSDFLRGSLGFTFFKLLALTLANNFQRPQSIDLEDFSIGKEDNGEVRKFKKKLQFVKNLARSAGYCRESLQETQNLEPQLKKLEEEIQKLSQEAQKEAHCGYSNPFSRGNSGRAQSLTSQYQCKNLEVIPEYKEQWDQKYHQFIDMKITFEMCKGRSNQNWQEIRREFQSFDAIALTKENIDDLQNRNFENTLRMGELILQVQGLDGDFDQLDKSFFGNMILPILGLDNPPARAYFDEYQAFLSQRGFLEENISSPTGFQVKETTGNPIFTYDFLEKGGPSTRSLSWRLQNLEPQFQPPRGYNSGYFNDLGF